MNRKENSFSREKKPAVGLETMVYGKVPPSSQRSEKAVLGALLLEKHALALVQDILTPEKFYLQAHQHVYRAILSLDNRNQPVDSVEVAMELAKNGTLEDVGGVYFLSTLTDGVVSAANIESHARHIHEKWMKRECIRVGGEMVAAGYDETVDPFDAVDEAEKGVSGIMNSSDRGKITPVDSAVAREIKRLYEVQGRENKLTGVPTGYTRLNELTNGWQATDLIILAARPAVGKTAFALNLARHAAISGVSQTPIAFFSLEMSTSQLTQRLISAETGVQLELIRNGRLDDGQIKFIMDNGAARIASSPIFIDDTPALNIFELRAKCRRLKNKHNIGFIIIDYLQLMAGSGKKGNREQEISEISRALKALAKELECPVLALSQLSRAVESRGEKEPQLSDLRESGAIEQDADMVMFLYRPEYYGIANNENGDSTKGETHVKIAKHRNGTLDTVKLTAKLDIQKFVEYEGGFTPPSPRSSFRPVPTPYKDNDENDLF